MDTVINVTRNTIKAKVENRPTISVFYAWTNPKKIYEYDTAETPYSLLWTTKGLAHDVESVRPDIAPIESYNMQEDHNSLYNINLQWNYWFPRVWTLSADLKFYLNEVFKFHLDSVS